ncbi:MAG TPA: PEP/pyruvate-binding domain-containing protein [Oscillatoriaceae cyanobacterium]
MTHRAVTPLRPFPDHQRPLVGAKAHALGWAIGLSAPVPPGFVVSALALARTLEENDLVDDWQAMLAAARRETSGWESLAEAFEPRLLAARLPEGLAREISEALRVLGATTVAVRSSATLEDGETSAAAGVFESVLNVPAESALDALKRVWASAYTPRAIAHALTLGQDPGQLRLGVIVQRMLAPEVAGVLFTTDPDDPERKTMRFAVTQGLAESLVQGEDGTDQTWPKRSRLPVVPGLEAKQAQALRTLALSLEKAADRAQDLEWALVEGEIHLLQTRPVTTLPPGAHARPAIRWSRDLATERFPDPISPLGWTALESALRVNLSTLDTRFGLSARRPDEIATVIGGYVYNNRDFFRIPQSMRFRASAHLPYLGGYLRTLLGTLAPRHWRQWLSRVKGPGSLGAHPDNPRVRAVSGLFETYVFPHAEDIAARWKRDFPEHRRAMDKLSAENPAVMTTPALMDYARRVIARSDDFMEPDLAIYVIKMACRWAVEELAAIALGRRDPSALATLTGGLAANATIAMNTALEQLETAVRDDAALITALRSGQPEAIAQAWPQSPAEAVRAQFLREYGHLTLSWDIRQPTYGEAPELLDRLLAQRLAAPEVVSVETRRKELSLARATFADRLARELGRAPEAKRFFYRALETLYTAMRLDEEHHLSCGRLIPAERRIVAELATRLVAAGAFDAPDDIHFLTLDEVFALSEEKLPYSRRRLVARRRAAYERAIAGTPVEEFWGTRPVSSSRTVPNGETLEGRPASPGRIEGVVRVVSAMDDMAAFRPGEILVLPTPKPSYTPLFAVAGGLVTARGSTLSHGLITAREYGLPAVTEIHDALDRLRTGQRVVLDGDAGVVTVLESAVPVA